MLHYESNLKRLGLFGMAPNNLGPNYRRGYVLYDTLVDCISVSANNTITPLKLGTTENFLVYYNYY